MVLAKPRCGITLLEVLVVIGVLAILLMVLIPAVQHAREAARRAECGNHMRQLAVSMQQFATANRDTFPNSGTFLGVSTTGSSGRLDQYLSWGNGMRNWVVDVLPYMENEKVAERWQFDRTFDDTLPSPNDAEWSNRSLGQNKISLLVCPNAHSVYPEARLTYAVNGGFNTWWGCPMTGLMYPDVLGKGMDYDGNGQVVSYCDDMRPETQGDRNAARALGLLWPGSTSGNTSQDVRRTIQSISDGTANTIMIAENIHAAHGEYFGFWLDLVHGRSWANPDPNVAAFHVSDKICPGGDCRRIDWSKANSPNTTTNRYKLPQNINGVREDLRRLSPVPQFGWPFPSSMHPTGLNVAMCDGSVRFLANTVDGEVYAKLVTPAASRLNPTWPVFQSPLQEDDF